MDGLIIILAVGYYTVDDDFSAGIGRTGTYIALDYLLDEAEEQDYVDVLGCLHKLRHARVNMVQNAVGT